MKIGWLESGFRYIATIEPWHGNQVVVYTHDATSYPGAMLLVERGEASRRVVAQPLPWGHAVWCANLDKDMDDELIIGQRDANSAADADPRGPGVFVFDPRPGTYPPVFDRITVDDGGMAARVPWPPTSMAMAAMT